MKSRAQSFFLSFFSERELTRYKIKKKNLAAKRKGKSAEKDLFTRGTLLAHETREEKLSEMAKFRRIIADEIACKSNKAVLRIFLVTFSLHVGPLKVIVFACRRAVIVTLKD